MKTVSVDTEEPPHATVICDSYLSYAKLKVTFRERTPFRFDGKAFDQLCREFCDPMFRKSPDKPLKWEPAVLWETPELRLQIARWRHRCTPWESRLAATLRHAARSLIPAQLLWDGPRKQPPGETASEWRKLEVVIPPRRVELVTFTDDFLYPALEQRNARGWDTWMSITPSEMLSLNPGISRAKGKVLLGGLGMGFMLSRIMRRPQVTSVTVVERSQELVKWLQPSIERLYRKRVRLVVGDAIDYMDRKGHQYDSVLMDIWRSYGDRMYDYDWEQACLRLKNKSPKTTTWGWG